MSQGDPYPGGRHIPAFGHWSTDGGDFPRTPDRPPTEGGGGGMLTYSGAFDKLRRDKYRSRRRQRDLGGSEAEEFSDEESGETLEDGDLDKEIAHFLGRKANGPNEATSADVSSKEPLPSQSPPEEGLGSPAKHFTGRQGHRGGAPRVDREAVPGVSSSSGDSPEFPLSPDSPVPVRTERGGPGQAKGDLSYSVMYEHISPQPRIPKFGGWSEAGGIAVSYSTVFDDMKVKRPTDPGDSNEGGQDRTTGKSLAPLDAKTSAASAKEVDTTGAQQGRAVERRTNQGHKSPDAPEDPAKVSSTTTLAVPAQTAKIKKSGNLWKRLCQKVIRAFRLKSQRQHH